MQLRDHVMKFEHHPIIRKRQKVVEQTGFSVVYFLMYFRAYLPVCVFPLFLKPPSKLDAYTVFHSIPTHRISTLFNCCLLDVSLYLPTMYPAAWYAFTFFISTFLGCPPFESSPSLPYIIYLYLELLTGARFCI